MPRIPIHLVLLAAIAPAGIVACAANDTEADDGYVYNHSPNDEVICRRQRVVGSHLPVRVCKTRAQMERERAAGARAMDDLRTMGGNEPRPPSPR